MKCLKVRKNKKKYCSSDFFYQIKLINKVEKSNEYNQIDNKLKFIQEYNLMCHIQIQAREVFSDGELLLGGTELKITTYYFVGSENIKQNPLQWFVRYDNKDYEISTIYDIDFRKEYTRIIANISAK